MFIKEGAVVSGYSALLVGVALRKLARDGSFDRVEPGARAELLALISEVERAGQAWRTGALPRDGSVEAPVPEIGPSSISAEHAATLLRVSPRRVRQLAPVLGGVKAGGQWAFQRDAVLAEAKRRRGQ